MEENKKKKILRVFNKKRTKAGKMIKHKETLKDYIEQTSEKADKHKKSLKRVWQDLQLLLLLIKDWLKGDYKELSVGAVIAIVSSLIYFVAPLDVIPDFLVGTGYLDDGFLFGYVIKQLSGEVDRYKEWKEIDSHDVTTITVEAEEV